ncbi:MAG TPA: polysaccharide deacetylase, partial [Vicinamibacteria bacterium]
MSLSRTALVLVLALAPAAVAQQAPQEEPSWKWPESRWRAAVDKVRAGKRLLPKAWPGGAKVAVALSFDFDNETLALRNGQTLPSLLSTGEYGSRAALPRVLALLEKYKIPATFFIPGVSAKLYPEDVKRIAGAGHEIGIHGWIHEWTSSLSRDEERMLMERSLATIQELTGKKPVGIRTGSWEYSANTAELIAELGLVYDSSLMADDMPYEVMSDGRPTGIVELPVEWILDDYPYFNMDRFAGLRPHTPPSGVYEVWSSEFDVAYDEGSLFLLTMHPQIVGHRSRMAMLEKLV